MSSRVQVDVPDEYEEKTGYVPVKGWPYRDDQMLRSDGQYWKDAEKKDEVLHRNEQYYGPDWIRQFRARKLLLAHDAVFQFMGHVAGRTGTIVKPNVLWRGGNTSAMGGAVTQMLVELVGNFHNFDGTGIPFGQSSSVMGQMLQRTKEEQDKMEEEKKKKEELNKRMSREESLLLPQNKSAIERVLKKTQDDDQPVRAQGSEGKSGESSYSGTRSDVTTDSSVILNKAAQGNKEVRRSHPNKPPRVVLTSSSSSSSSSSSPSPAPDASSGKPYTLGIDDKWLRLFELMRDPRTTATQLQAWTKMYEESGKSEEEKFYDELRRDPAKLSQYLRDLAEIQRILESGNGLADWAVAPENAGYLFMEDRLKTALLRAITVVRDVCSKQWVTQEMLITSKNPAVVDLFAELVAYYVIEYSTSGYSSRVLGADFSKRQKEKYAHIVGKFKLLQRGDPLSFDHIQRRGYDEYAETCYEPPRFPNGKRITQTAGETWADIGKPVQNTIMFI